MRFGGWGTGAGITTGIGSTATIVASERGQLLQLLLFVTLSRDTVTSRVHRTSTGKIRVG
jgi:hypothetical protein